MILVERGEVLTLHPSPKHPDAPLLSLPLLSLHSCSCGALLKAYAATVERPKFRSYDPDKRFKFATVPGGLILLREQHGETYSPCFGSSTSFTPTEAARLVVQALWHGAHNYDAPPELLGVVDRAGLPSVPGVRVVDDSFERRPPIYLVNPKAAVDELITEVDYRRYEEWKASMRAMVERFVADLTYSSAPSVEVRTLSRIPRPRPKTPPTPEPEAPSAPPPLVLAPPPAPPVRRRPAVQLSLF